MSFAIPLVTLVVPDYDRALEFFVAGLGFDCTADLPQGDKRWVVVTPPGGGAAILLARATTDRQRAAIGSQAGGRVGFFLHTADFDDAAARITRAGGSLIETPRDAPYGRVAQWRDPWGNLWDLIQPAPAPGGAS